MLSLQSISLSRLLHDVKANNLYSCAVALFQCMISVGIVQVHIQVCDPNRYRMLYGILMTLGLIYRTRIVFIGYWLVLSLLNQCLYRVPVTFCTLTVTKETLVQDAIAEALDRFGLERSTANRYNLIEVSLDRGVAERTANPQENMLQLVRNLRKVSGSHFSFNYFR